MKEKSRKIILSTALLCLSFSTLNAKTIEIKVIDAPKVDVIIPSVNIKIISSAKYNDKNNNTIIKKLNSGGIANMGKRTPPKYNKKKIVEVSKELKAGEVENSRISAYLQTSFMSVVELEKRLDSAGFNVISKFKVDKKGKYISLVFTNRELQKQASKKSRGFASSLRLIVDTKNKKVTISNPLYVMKAFMQDDFNEKIAKNTLNKLHSIFKDLKNSKDIVKFTTLSNYHFMENMPYYQNSIKLSSGKNETLLAKAKASKNVVFEQKLDNGSILIGVKLSKRTSKFVKKIGYQNAQLLPYPILIEDGEAKILDPKYYISVMYPMLSMEEFMSIATIPGAIQKECDRIFR